LGRIYGAQWRDWGGRVSNKHQNHNGTSGVHFNGIDQIQNIITKLKTTPDDRRMLVTAWNPDEIDTCVLPPCHYGFQVYTRELSEKERMDTLTQNEQRLIYEEVQSFKNVRRKKIKECLDEKNIPTRAISLMWNQRSVDTFLNLSSDIASYGLLLEILAKITNMVPDELIGNLGDAHLYLNHIEQAKEQIGREPYPLPKLNINTEFWLTESGECGVGNLTENFESLIEGIQIDDFTIENYQSQI